MCLQVPLCVLPSPGKFCNNTTQQSENNPALCVNLTNCGEESRQTFSKYLPYDDSIYIMDTSRQNQALQMEAGTMVPPGRKEASSWEESEVDLRGAGHVL